MKLDSLTKQNLFSITQLGKPPKNFRVSSIIMDIFDAIYQKANLNVLRLIEKHFGKHNEVKGETPNFDVTVTECEHTPSDRFPSYGNQKTEEEDEEDYESELNVDYLNRVVKRLGVSCLSPFGGEAYYPEAPATCDDISKIVRGLLHEIRFLAKSLTLVTHSVERNEAKIRSNGQIHDNFVDSTNLEIRSLKRRIKQLEMDD